MHLPPDAIQPVLGFIGAAISTVSLWLAQAGDVSAQARGWMEVGGTVGLIGGLTFACVTLWKSLAARDKAIADLNREIRGSQKEQNDKLIEVLNKLDPDS